MQQLPITRPALIDRGLVEGLWKHQEREVIQRGLEPEWIQLWKPRTGKTKAALRKVMRWHLEAGVNRILISAPKTVCESVWAPEVHKELQEFSWFHKLVPEVQVIDLYRGSLKDRQKELDRAINDRKDRLTKGRGLPMQVAIVNRDGLANLEDDILRWLPQGVIFDELHDYKNVKALRSLAAFHIRRQCRFALGLTGTPAPNGYKDIFGQWKVIAPRIFGTAKGKFNERYLNLHPMFKSTVVSYRTENLPELKEKAFSIASIIKREDVFDVPTHQVVERTLHLPDNIRSIYQKIVKDHVLELQEADYTKRAIPMNHTLSRLLQLRQLAIGYLRYDAADLDDDGDLARETKWVWDGRIEAVKTEAVDIIESGEKVIIFHTFRPEGQKIAESLKGYKPLLLNGSVSGEDRKFAIERFRDDPNFPVIVVQEKVGSLGISLAASSYSLFLSCGMGHDDHEQARDRMFKPQNEGGTVQLTSVYFWVERTVDRIVKQTLDYKRTAEEMFLAASDLYGSKAKAFEAIANGI
jgi:hypothetical protein